MPKIGNKTFKFDILFIDNCRDFSSQIRLPQVYADATVKIVLRMQNDFFEIEKSVDLDLKKASEKEILGYFFSVSKVRLDEDI